MTEVKEYRIRVTGNIKEHGFAETRVRETADEICSVLTGLCSEAEFYIVKQLSKTEIVKADQKVKG